MREDHVRSVLDEARRRLGEVTKDTTKYEEVLLTLIVQGLYQIMEPKVSVRARQVDHSLVQGLLSRASAQYKEQTGKDVVLTLESDAHLPADTCGGIELTALNGRIRVSDLINSITLLIDGLTDLIHHLSIKTFFETGTKYSGIALGTDFATIGPRNSYLVIRTQSKPQVHRLN